jgi:hypothetical protein
MKQLLIVLLIYGALSAALMGIIFRFKIWPEVKREQYRRNQCSNQANNLSNVRLRPASEPGPDSK